MSRQGWASVELWLGRMGPGTAPLSRYHFERLMAWLAENGRDFASFTPDQLVEHQANSTGRGRYAILDRLQEYILKTLQGQRKSSKDKAYSVVRSFFLHNRAELPRDPSFSIRGDVGKVVGQLKAEEVRKIILSSNKAYRAIYLCMIQGGLDRDSFTYWNLHGWPALVEALRSDPKVVRIDLPGRKGAKNERPFYTLIGEDAISALKDWLKARPENDKAIFTDQYKASISSKAVKDYWDRKLVRLGLIERRKGKLARNGDVRYEKNPHEMRDVFRSLWEKSPANKSIAEFMMGHEVDPLQYNKACNDEGWVHEEYMKAAPWLNLLSSGRPFDQFSKGELEDLRIENETLKREMRNQRLQNEELRTSLQEYQNRSDIRIEDVRREFMAKLEELRPQVIEGIRLIDSLES